MDNGEGILAMGFSKDETCRSQHCMTNFECTQHLGESFLCLSSAFLRRCDTVYRLTQDPSATPNTPHKETYKYECPMDGYKIRDL
jgi:hypothetical protein